MGKRTQKLSKIEMENLKILLSVLGVEFYQTEQEADQLLSQLNQETPNSYVITNDSDIFLYGAKSQLIDLNSTKQQISIVNLKDIFTELNIDQEQLISICLLSGCDYIQRIKGLGIHTAYKLIKQHKNLENNNLREFIKKKYHDDIDRQIELKNFLLIHREKYQKFKNQMQDIVEIEKIFHPKLSEKRLKSFINSCLSIQKNLMSNQSFSQLNEIIMSHKGVLLVLLFFITNSQSYDYEISRGKALWAGMYNVVHYVDEFNFLSQKTPGVHGVMSTYFPLQGGGFWHLNYELNINGKISSLQDGFLMIISSENPSPADITEYKTKQKVDQNLMKKQGVQIWINGEGYLNSAYMGALQSKENKITRGRCQIDLNKSKIFLMLTLDNSEFIISYHYENQHQYEQCVKLQLEKNLIEQFFPIFYAKSSKQNPLLFSIKSMTFNSAVENPSIQEYEGKYDQNMTKLFKTISLLAKNSDLVKRSERFKNEDKLNIPTVYQREKRIDRYLKNSKYQIMNSLDETDLILNYMGIHQNSSKSYAMTILDGMQSWLDNSVKNLTEMDSSLELINKEVDQFEFDKVIDETKSLMERIKNIKKTQEDSFTQLTNFHEQIMKNFKILSNFKLQQKNMNKNMKKFIKKNKNVNMNQMNDTLSILLGALGSFIVLILLVILYKVSKMKNMGDVIQFIQSKNQSSIQSQ